MCFLKSLTDWADCFNISSGRWKCAIKHSPKAHNEICEGLIRPEEINVNCQCLDILVVYIYIYVEKYQLKSV